MRPASFASTASATFLAFAALVAWVASAVFAASPAHAADPADCAATASDACYRSFTPPGAGGAMHYYASLPADPAGGTGPTRALIAMHGHPRDANKTFDAALAAVRGATDVLVVAPVYQVSDAQAARCHTKGVPAARPGDLLWSCSSWLEGGLSSNGAGLGSFAAMDALIAELKQRWPSLREITLAGFSAGAQMVQHSIGFAADAPAGVVLRYVVADPGTWLYFDPVRPVLAEDGAGYTLAPVATFAACRGVDRWKYGLQDPPAHLSAAAAGARARYARADITYLEGALDASDAPGTAYKVLDKSCAANAQGPYRRQRGEAYVHYDHALLSPKRPRRFIVVPGCAHDVACVFPSAEARRALLGEAR